MPRRPTSPWPTTPGTVFLGRSFSASTLGRAVREGRIRRLAQGVYTADLVSDPADLVSRNRWTVVAGLLPDAMIADRSAALQGLPAEGVLFVVSRLRRSPVELPGLVVSPREGDGPLDDDPPWAAGLRMSSEARTLVDNLALSRARGLGPARTLARDELEDWLVRTSQRRPDDWLGKLRAHAVDVAEQLGVPERRAAVEDIVGAVAGTRPVRSGAGRLLTGRVGGREWDPQRVERFDQLARYLLAVPETAEVPSSLRLLDDDADGDLPFFEAYFSNFIEGTEFTVEEAERIVVEGTVPPARPEDGHDVLGTYAVVHDPVDRRSVPSDGDELIELSLRRHGAIMAARPEKRPGELKERRNQAGSYVFVEPELVVGTLVEGFRRADDLPRGFARAAFLLFLLSEVHPFDDGNGRVARAAMGAELSADHQARIVVPVVFRNEYLTALRALSRDGRCELFVRTLAFAWRWTAAMPWDDRQTLDGMLEATNALTDSTDAERTGVRLTLP